jgi:hypothetical protein
MASLYSAQGALWIRTAGHIQLTEIISLTKDNSTEIFGSVKLLPIFYFLSLLRDPIFRSDVDKIPALTFCILMNFHAVKIGWIETKL